MTPAYKKDVLVPVGWEADGLSKFLQAAHENRVATYATKKAEYQKLADIDACFLTIAGGWLNPVSLITPHLFVRAHAAYRAACEHALAGQLAEVFPMSRVALEYAGYAIHLHHQPMFEEVWLKRHDSEATLQAVKEEFKISNVKATIKKYDQHNAIVFNDLYQRAIDFGGHPNEGALSTNLKLVESDDKREYLQLCLHGDGMPMEYGLKTTAQTGVCVLQIFQDVFKGRFELLGVRAKVLELRKGL